jgi:hypothetical protein
MEKKLGIKRSPSKRENIRSETQSIKPEAEKISDFKAPPGVFSAHAGARAPRRTFGDRNLS